MARKNWRRGDETRADDYIAKGRLQIEELEMRIARALRQQNLETENVALHQQLDKAVRPGGVDWGIARDAGNRRDRPPVAPTRANVFDPGRSARARN